MRIACFDLESTNLKGDLGICLCGVVKEVGKKSAIFRIDADPSYQKHRWDDSKVVRDVRDCLEEFDIIVGWNSGGGPFSFDIPFLQTRLMMSGLRPLHLPKHVDLMRTAKFQLKFKSNSLASVSESLLMAGKTKLDGRVWTRAMVGHKPSIDTVVHHCIKDVEVLEGVLSKLGKHVKNIRDWI